MLLYNYKKIICVKGVTPFSLMSLYSLFKVTAVSIISITEFALAAY